MATPPQNEGRRRGISGSSEGLQDTVAARHDQALAEAQRLLEDGCRRFLALGVQPGFISITFGRVMRELTTEAGE